MVQDGTAALANQLLPAAGAFGIAFSASLAQNLLELYDEHVIATATQGELLSVHDQSSFKAGFLMIGPAVDFEALATETANKITEKETQVQELETTKQSVDDVTAKIDAVVGGARSILNIMDIIRQTCQ